MKVEGENAGKEERRKFPDSPFEEPVPLQREGRGMLKLLVQDAGSMEYKSSPPARACLEHILVGSLPTRNFINHLAPKIP
jgi:hypothetical protein